VGSFAVSPSGLLIGYKVMAWDPAARRLVSGANRSIQLPLRRGAIHTMPGAGIFLAATDRYVLDHYAHHDVNALLAYEFDPKTITRGNLTDREPEIAVPSAKLLDYRLLDEDLHEVW
jgi:hypothetical protein